MKMDQTFKSGQSEISRNLIESMASPFDTTIISDGQMQRIVDELEQRYQERIEGRDYSEGRVREIWWEELESRLQFYDVPYLEDYSSEDYGYYLNRVHDMEIDAEPLQPSDKDYEDLFKWI